MKIIDFSFKQIENPSLEEEFFSSFLNEYSKLCDIPDEYINNETGEQVKKTDKAVLQSNIQKVMDTLKRSEKKIQNFLGNIEIPPVILFIGPPMAWDGHGIIVNGKTYTFLNLSMMEHHFSFPGFIPDVHAIHEILHGIHYNLFPEYYPGNCKTVKELYFNKLLSEGIATYLSGKINNSSTGEALSFGFISDEGSKILVEKSEAIKNQSGLLLKKSVIENSHNKELWRSLFFVPDIEEGCLTRGRFGYYYGMKISEIAAEKLGNICLIKTAAEGLHPFVNSYFT